MNLQSPKMEELFKRIDFTGLPEATDARVVRSAKKLLVDLIQRGEAGFKVRSKTPCMKLLVRMGLAAFEERKCADRIEEVLVPTSRVRDLD